MRNVKVVIKALINTYIFLLKITTKKQERKIDRENKKNQQKNII